MYKCEENIEKLEKINNKLKYTNEKVKRDLSLLKKTNQTNDDNNYKISLKLRTCIENILNNELK